MAEQNAKYWSSRANTRLSTSEEIGNTGISGIVDIYKQALHNIDRMMRSVYDNYAVKGVLSHEVLRETLKTADYVLFKSLINKQAKLLRIDPKSIYDTRYLYRLSRLDAIKQQINLEVLATAEKERNLSTKTYKNIISTNYEQAQLDYKNGGITPSFKTIDRPAVDAILRSTWYGGNYSTRIWGDTIALADELPQIIGGAMVSGQSYQKTARILRNRFDVRLYDATRLVRTETNYINNQVEIQSYVDDGILEYEYHAEIDNKTSDICRELDNRVFKVSEAETGTNYPPMHPNCRSTTVPRFSGEENRIRKRSDGGRFERFQEPTTPKVPRGKLPIPKTVQELEARWGEIINAKTFEPFNIKLRQGGDKALNAETEWIANVARRVTDKEMQKTMIDRLDEIIKIMKDDGQRQQIVFLKKYVEFPE